MGASGPDESDLERCRHGAGDDSLTRPNPLSQALRYRRNKPGARNQLGDTGGTWHIYRDRELSARRFDFLQIARCPTPAVGDEYMLKREIGFKIGWGFRAGMGGVHEAGIGFLQELFKVEAIPDG